MNGPITFCAGVLALAFVCNAGAELKKLRNWPSGVPEPTSEIKRQFEYDPDAAAISPSLTFASIKVSYGSKIGSIHRVNYQDSSPVSGAKDWNFSVSAYHGFIPVMTSTTKMKFQKDSAWPSANFKTYYEYTYDGTATKVGLVCKRIKSPPAASIFPELPGQIYRYDCAVTSATESNGYIHAPNLPVAKNYYSDYLDTTIYADAGYKSLVVEGVEQTITVEFGFNDKAGNPKKITLIDSQMRSVFDQN